MWTPSPDALVTDLGTELVLLHAVSGEMVNLNGTAREGWLALPGTVADVAAALTRSGAAPAEAMQDAQDLLADLQRHALIQPE